MEPERAVDSHSLTGEGPMWHPDEQVLYWVDIPDGELFRYDPEAGENELVYDDPDAIGGYTIQADGSLLLFEDSGRVEHFDDGEAAVVIEALPGEAESRFNDVIADPEGRVFAGTMPTDDHLGSLYRLDTHGSIGRVYEDVDVPNGMGFAPDRETMYFAESEARLVHQFDYDADSGAIDEVDPFIEVDGPEVPDGLTVDGEGDVWIAFWDGGRVGRYAPDGVEREVVEFPAKKVSSITFGGEDYEDAYVTTALGEDGNAREEEGDGAGSLFRFEPGVSGVPEFRSRIEL
ncbi:SMP-30/gluconolactonase/LRE family protein [Salinarchaeum sp. Harcht-Bsk1]|uniref:SMP-30/gluconolactonase/LRE family protein n=1 Tax=Salinarchaeum sp. Harcht-Bsk1 TaxID=1333523 RepID=UPI000677EF2A|nr:SMP-30/gluconolactonase/LRE family protein [Salinarchaeum sp. Harcht-Bsk1]